MPIFSDQSDKLLQKLDKKHGIAAILKIPTGTTIDIAAGTDTIEYDSGGAPASVKVRSAGLSVLEKNQIRDSGITNFDAVWYMRSSYASTVKPGYILQVAGLDYEVVTDGASLDELQLLWTIITRRRFA